MLKHPALRFARAVCRSRVRVLLTRCGVLAACLLYGASVSAQASPGADKAVAEALFDRGLTLMRQGQFEQACAQLEQSQSIERGIGTMLYLAECYEKLGDLAKARERNDEFLRLWANADPDLPLLADAKALQVRLAVK